MKNNAVKRLISLLLVLVVMISIPVSALAFNDVPAWCSAAVNALARQGVLEGYDDGSFRPDEALSRAACAKLLAEICYPLQDYDGSHSYEQKAARQNPGYWANGYIAISQVLGVDDFGWTQANWDKAATRAEMAEMTYAFFRSSTMATTSNMTVKSGIENYIGDYSIIRWSSCRDAVLWMYSFGLVDGVDDNGSFDPSGRLTRAQGCVLLYRIIDSSTRVDVTAGSVVQSRPSVTGSPAAGATTATDFAVRVVELVNKERAASGLAALTMDAELNASAEVRADEITGYFSHTRPDGTKCFTAFPAKFANGMRGENIAGNYSTPEKVVSAWMNSSGHRANILNSSFSYIGVGYAYSGGEIYWAQLFAG